MEFGDHARQQFMQSLTYTGVRSFEPRHSPVKRWIEQRVEGTLQKCPQGVKRCLFADRESAADIIPTVLNLLQFEWCSIALADVY